jgi:hypothetical protein
MNPLTFIFGVMHSAPRVPRLSRFSLVAYLVFKVAHAPEFFASLFRLSSRQQNVIDAGCRNTFHGTSVCVQARGGPRAADVRASMWTESQLLLQIPAADGRADGNPDEHDLPVSEKIVHGSGGSD